MKKTNQTSNAATQHCVRQVDIIAVSQPPRYYSRYGDELDGPSEEEMSEPTNYFK